MSDNTSPSSRGDEAVLALEDGLVNPLRGDATVVTHREEAKDSGSDLGWTL